MKLAWEEFDQIYSLLPVDQQHALHRYYQPLSDHTIEQLKDYRANITKREPSLPARAGKCYAKLRRVYETGIEAAKGKQREPRRRSKRSTAPSPAVVGSRSITVRAVARPDPDLKKLALVLIEVGKQVAGNERVPRQRTSSSLKSED